MTPPPKWFAPTPYGGWMAPNARAYWPIDYRNQPQYLQIPFELKNRGTTDYQLYAAGYIRFEYYQSSGKYDVFDFRKHVKRTIEINLVGIPKGLPFMRLKSLFYEWGKLFDRLHLQIRVQQIILIPEEHRYIIGESFTLRTINAAILYIEQNYGET